MAPPRTAFWEKKLRWWRFLKTGPEKSQGSHDWAAQAFLFSAGLPGPTQVFAQSNECYTGQAWGQVLLAQSLSPEMCRFIFKRERYSRVINLFSFFAHLQTVALCGDYLLDGRYSCWVGEVSLTHSSQQVAQHRSSGPVQSVGPKVL
jgi:hypothetical protein